MAGRITQWGAGQFLGAFFGREIELPDNFYLALIQNVAPSAYVSGAELDEPQGDGYARSAVPNDTLTWTGTGQLQMMSLLVDIPFLEATADWGTIRYWALCNAEVDGYAYVVGNLETPLTVSSGDTVVLGEGDLVVSLGPFYAAVG